MRKRSIILFTVFLMVATCISGCHKEKVVQKDILPQEIKPIYEEIRRAANPTKLPESSKNRKDSLIVGINAPSGKFNPVYSNSIYDSWVCALVFGGLISNDENGKPVANVASEWKISEDGKTYNFKLRSDVKFSDGSDLTSEDVAFTFTTLCDPKYSGIFGNSFRSLIGYKEYVQGDAKTVSGIKAIDKFEISFTFTEVRASVLADFGIGILPRKYYDFKKGEIKALDGKLLTPMGSGPYKFKEYKPDNEITFERNTTYWKGEPLMPYITMKINNGNSNTKGLLAGDIDINRVPATVLNVKTIEEAGFLDMHLYDNNGYQYIGLNLRKEMFKDKRVRQALLYGLNRKEFIDSYYGGYGNLYNTPFAQCSWAYPDEINEYPYDKEKANKLLEEAGWILKEDGFRYNSEGKKFTIKWATFEGNKYVEKLIPQVKGDWKLLGIEVIEDIMPFVKLVEKVYDKQDFEMYNMSWTLAIDPDPSPIFSKAEDTLGGYNAVGWRNDQSEKLIQDGLKEINQEKRKTIYKEWAKLANEELPYLYLNQNKEMFVVNSKVKNLQLSSFMDWTLNVHKLTLEAK